MKKYVALFVWFGLPILMFGQIQKGSWMIGGKSDFTYNHTLSWRITDTQISNQIFINPSLGYFFTDRFAFGCRYQLFRFREHSESLEHPELIFDGYFRSHRISPFIRYQFQRKNWSFYGDLHMHHIKGEFKFEELGASFQDKKYEYIDWTVSLGINLFVSENLALNGALRLLLDRVGKVSRSFQAYEKSGFGTVGLQYYINTRDSKEYQISNNLFRRGSPVFYVSGKGQTILGTSDFKFNFDMGFRSFVHHNAELEGTAGVKIYNTTNGLSMADSNVKMTGRYYFQISENLFFAPDFSIFYRLSRIMIPTRADVFIPNIHWFGIALMPKFHAFVGGKNLLKLGIYSEIGNVKKPFERTSFFSFGWQINFEHFIQRNVSFEFVGNWNLFNEQFQIEDLSKSESENFSYNSGIQTGLNYYFFSNTKKRRKPRELN